MRIRKLLFVIYLSLTCALTHAQQQPRLVLPVGHTGRVNSASFSSDSKYVFTDSDDHTARIWDVSTGKEIQIFQRKAGYLKSSELSSDGKYVATIFGDSVIIWDASTGEKCINLSGHKSGIISLSFSNDGKYIATGSRDSIAKIWDLKTGKELYDLHGHKDYVNGVLFSPNGKYVMTKSSDHTIKVWNLFYGAEIYTIRHTDRIASISFSIDGDKAVSSAWDSTVKIWEASSGKELYMLKGHSDMVNSASFSTDGKYLVTAAWDSTAKIWDVLSGKELYVLKGHYGVVESATFSIDGKYVVTTSDDNTARIWDASCGKQLCVLNGNKAMINSASFSMDGKYIVTASDDGSAKIWDVLTGLEINTLKGKTKSLIFASFCAEDKYVLSACNDKTVRVWDVTNGKELNRLKGHTGYIISISLDNEEKKVATTSLDSTARIWDVLTGKQLHVLKGHYGVVESATFSIDGKYVVTASEDSTARIWNVLTGKQIHVLKGHTGKVTSASFSNDGEYVVTASEDRTARIWDVLTGNEFHTLRGHEYRVVSASFNPDKKYVVTASSDGMAKIWDASSGKEIRSLVHEGRVISSRFSPNGKFVLTTSWDGSAKIWDALTGDKIYSLRGNKSFITSASFNQNGNYVVTPSWDGTTSLWELSNGKELHILEGHTDWVKTAFFSNNAKWIITTGDDHKTILWDAATGKQLYTRLQLENDDWLIYDEDYHFDGTPGAIEKLYFTCGLEIIELSQVKQSLRIRGLAQKIMNREDLSGYKKLSDLNICGQLPLIEQTNDSLNLSYSITKRKATILRFEVLLNKKIIKTILPEKLTWKNNHALLKLNRKEIESLFTPGQANVIKIQAVTNIEGEEIPSRGVEVSVQDYRDKKQPSLYGVFIGVNEYQDPSMSLKFPVNDALSMSSMIGSASEALMGKEKVELFNIHSDYDESKKNGYGKPTRQTVRRALAEIAEKAEPQDIVFLFLAGHGTMGNKTEKRFTFLTEEASFDNPQGINTDTLFSWISTEGPFALKANKVILVLDACNSGQILSDLSKRSLEEEERQKQLDALADRSGMFIITASASGKEAYELPKLEHGLLTYSLLRVLKQNASIYEKDDYVNMTRWFYEAGRDLGNLTKELKLTQEAIPSGTGDFSIMRVNASMRSGIRLAEEKQQLFLESVENITEEKPDRKLWNRIVDRIRTEKETARCFYLNDRYLEGARVLRIKYSLKGKKINCRLLVYLNDEKIKEFEIKGNTEKWEDLERAIVELLKKEYCAK